MNKVISTALASVFLSAGAASLAIAQTATPAPNAPASSAAPKGEHHVFSHASPTERVEQRLSHMKAELKITDAQQAQWDAYANVLRKNTQEREQRHQAQPTRGQRLNAVERLERQQTLVTEAAARLNELLAVEKPLYVSLSPEQNKTADKVLNRSFRQRHEHGIAGFFHRHSRSGQA